MSASTGPGNAPLLNRERHIKYWLRCLRTVLPTNYTSNDSNRMTLAFFTLSALDLLSALDTHVGAEERVEYINWLYQCQHPEGGFRGFTGTDFGKENRNKQNAAWDSANLPGTFFALSTLLVLGDNLERVHRKECLTWIRQLQCEDGSVGEVLNADGKPAGTRDVRFSFLAACVRWMLRVEHEEDNPEDIDLDALAASILTSKVCCHQEEMQTWKCIDW